MAFNVSVASATAARAAAARASFRFAAPAIITATIDSTTAAELIGRLLGHDILGDLHEYADRGEGSPEEDHLAERQSRGLPAGGRGEEGRPVPPPQQGERPGEDGRGGKQRRMPDPSVQ
jgi:hypothetical protein